ncbi:MAG: RHS repeat-associated core domain-containing protein [Clostridia bacterium]|nr:RHS repeat-associated core domain-containing protein [Clostridia bacterium]
MCIYVYHSYHLDAQGNVKSILDSNGKGVVGYWYDAWGNIVATNGDSSYTELANLNPFRYRGYYYDTETGLYYLKTRYYDPEIGRFINMDSIDYADPETINGLNLYAYCNNNPVMNIDPDGTWSWKKFWNSAAIVAMVAVSAVAVVAGVALTITTGGIGAAVLLGAGIGALSNTIATIEDQGGIKNIEDFDIQQTFNSFLIGGAVGAATGVFSYGMGKIVGSIGNSIGYSLSQSYFLGSKIGNIISPQTLGEIGNVLGYVSGGLVGNAVSDNAVNKATGNYTSLGHFVGNLFKESSLGWFGDLLYHIIH